MEAIKFCLCLFLLFFCLSVTFGGCGNDEQWTQEDFERARRREIERLIIEDAERRHNEAFGELAPYMHKTWE